MIDLSVIKQLKAVNAELLAALENSDKFVRSAQHLLTMYLEPGDCRIQSEEAAISALLNHFDGPHHRKVRMEANAAIAKAKENKQ